MTTKVKALDRLIDAIAGSDVPVAAQTVAGTIDALADTLAGSDVTFTAQDIAGRLDELAKMVEDGTISIGGGGGQLTAPYVEVSTSDGVKQFQAYKDTYNGNDAIAWCTPYSLSSTGDGYASFVLKNGTTENVFVQHRSDGVANIMRWYTYNKVIYSDSSTYTFDDIEKVTFTAVN